MKQHHIQFVEDSRVLVNIQGNVTGLIKKDLNDNTHDKYTNALVEYKTLSVGETFLASKIELLQRQSTISLFLLVKSLARCCPSL